ELAAQINKDTTKVPDQCAHCSGPLFCQSCQKITTHRPYPKQAIRALIRKVVNGEPDPAFDYLDDVRNMLLHGEEKDEIEKKTKKPMTDAVDLAGRIAWVAILRAIDLRDA